MSFGDIRVAKRADWLIDRIVATGSLVLRKIGGTRAGEVAVHRFLSSPYVSVENIVETLAGRTATQGKGRRLLDGSRYDRDQFCRPRQEASRFWTGGQRQGSRLFYSPGDRHRCRDGSSAGACRCRHLDARARTGGGAPQSDDRTEGIGTLACGLRSSGRIIAGSRLGDHGG